ncbi:MAG: sialate O-acetylesterase [Nibricoccus sp.]
MNGSRLFTLAALCATLSIARADVSCPAIFGDHMVLQRERPVAVWGNATPGEQVTVEFGGQSKSTKATPTGDWRLEFAAMPASKESRVLTIRGNNTVTFSDVLVGEVWFCSGQSNMEKQLGPRKGQKPTDNYEEATRNADHPLLRLYQVPHYSKPTEKILSLRWVACTPESVAATEFSAAGYYFGTELLKKLDVPIGLIHSSYGGTRIEAWLPASVFERPEFKGLAGGPGDASFKDVGATKLYDSMVAPYLPYTLRGFIWYQGESNLMVGDTSIYTMKLRTLVETWRTAFQAPDAPFYYVLLAPFFYSGRDKDRAHLTAEGLPLFWEAQSAVASTVKHTGFVTTTDLVANVKDIHPTNKRDVGLRLANLALAETYSIPNIAAHGPSLSTVTIAKNRIELTFANVGDGLKSRDNKPLDSFQIAGADQHFSAAEAKIEGKNKVIVWSSTVEEPFAVRFAWNETANPNLLNSAGLPATPFRTDDWPVNVERTLPPAPVAVPSNQPASTTK